MSVNNSTLNKNIARFFFVETTSTHERPFTREGNYLV